MAFALVARIGLAMSAIVGWASAASSAAPATDSESIWKTLRARSDAAESVEVVWNRRMIRSGDQSAMNEAIEKALAGGRPLPDLRKSSGRPEVKGPSEDCKLVLAGGRARYEYSAGDEVTTSAFDGKRQQSLYGADEHRGGGIRDLPDFDEWSNVHLFALFLGLRPLHAKILGDNPSEWKVQNQTESIGGRPCVVLTRSKLFSRDHRYVQRVYFDIASDFLPLRYDAESDGVPSSRVDILYSRTEDPRWVPSSWTATFFRDGKFWEKTENELRTVALGAPVSDDTFLVKYPDGMNVPVIDSSGKEKVMSVVSGELAPRRRVVAEETSGDVTWWPWAAGAASLLLAGVLAWRLRAVRG